MTTTEDVPDSIGVSETKFNENTCTNVDIPDYIFLNSNSTTSAGGVGLYVKSDIESIRRYDFELTAEGLESFWIEIIGKKTKEYYCRLHLPTPFQQLGTFSRNFKRFASKS